MTVPHTNGVNGVNGVHGGHPRTPTDYQIREEPIHTRRPLRVVCMGAGYSGILMGIIWRQKLLKREVELAIYERNADIGGTWLENRYPGCQCDIPAHNYAYSFEQNPEWPNYYATSQQIYSYLKNTCKKYGVEECIRYRHSITRAEWNDISGKWILDIKGDSAPFQDECDIFVNAGGVLK